MKTAFLAASLVALTSMSVSAQVAIKPSDELMRKITPLLTSQANSIQYFQAPADNIAIGVVTKSFDKRVYYTTPDGDYLLSGMMFDVNAKKSFNDQITSQLKVVLPDAYTQPLLDANTITLGNGDKKIYAFVDIRCPHCHGFHKDIKDRMAKGELVDTTVHYILVGIMGSQDQASAILGESDVEKQYAMFDQAMQKGSNVTAKPAALLKGKASLKTNELIFAAHGGGVPLVLSEVAGDWQLNKGRPRPQFYQAFTKPVSNIVATETVAP